MNDYIIDFIKHNSIKILDIDFLMNNLSTLTKESYQQSEDLFIENFSNGIPGLIILSEELNRRGIIDDTTNTDDLISILLSSVKKNPVWNLSLFEGITGVAFTLEILDRKDLQGVIEQINEVIYTLVDQVIEEQKNRIGKPTYSYDYDIMYGISGVLNYLVNFSLNPKNNNVKAKKYIRKIELHLISYFSSNIYFDNKFLPPWYISKSNQMTKEDEIRYPNGNFNISMSHGISGLLSSLSTAVLNGMTEPGLLNLLEKLHDFIINYLNENKGVLSPPLFIDLNSYINGKKINNHRFDSWCYGFPGVSVSLLQYTEINNDLEERKLLLNNLKILNEETVGIDSPGICHGYAGIISVINSVCRFKKININPYLIESTLEYFNDMSMTGFYNKTFISNGIIQKKQELGMLNGTAGVFLSLLLNYGTQHTKWGKFFNL